METPETKKEFLDKVLQDLINTGGIEASVIASLDGLVIAANMSSGQAPETFAAMTATMFGAAQTATAELKIDLPDKVVVETPKHKLIAVGAGLKAILVVQCSFDAGLGLVLNEMNKSVPKIKTILE